MPQQAEVGVEKRRHPLDAASQEAHVVPASDCSRVVFFFVVEKVEVRRDPLDERSCRVPLARRTASRPNRAVSESSVVSRRRARCAVDEQVELCAVLDDRDRGRRPRGRRDGTARASSNSSSNVSAAACSVAATSVERGSWRCRVNNRKSVVFSLTRTPIRGITAPAQPSPDVVGGTMQVHRDVAASLHVVHQRAIAAHALRTRDTATSRGSRRARARGSAGRHRRAVRRDTSGRRARCRRSFRTRARSRRCWVFGPAPHNRATDNGASHATAVSRRHDRQTVGLRKITRDLRDVLRARNSDRRDQPGRILDRVLEFASDRRSGSPNRCSLPDMSRNASSRLSGSTSGREIAQRPPSPVPRSPDSARSAAAR